ncbi:Metallo-dependent phosphatase-like protein [Russula dissimulans]|nr:Metallo-dependent phosphatase-like protein [Russula dissimulans]
MIIGKTQLERRAICEIQYRATAPFTQHLYNGRIVSTRDRVIKEVQVPTATIPTDDQFFSKTEKGKPDVAFLKDHFYHEGRIKEEHALYIIKEANRLLHVEPNVLTIDTPAIVCGDIRGQYYDLMKLFEIGGDPAKTSYLFLGNYVNKGYFSMECLLYLWSLKIWYPKSLFLLRGFNEAQRWGNSTHTFETECKHKYSKRVYEAFLKSFWELPLAAIMGKQFLCIHSGISPNLRTIDDIRKLKRFREPPTSGLMNDILRLIPVEDFGQERRTEHFVDKFGYSYSYTYKAVCDFLDHNRLSSVIRAHSMQPSGYHMYRDNPKTGFPSVMSIFSAPDYRSNNKAAIVKFEKDMFRIWQFESSPHPYYLPDFMNAFSWSLPLICRGREFA